MDNPLIAIGQFVFYSTAPSFRLLRNTLEPRWSEQERVSRAPAGQFIGAANPTLDIEGVIYPEMFGNGDMIDQMATAANSGTLFTVVGMAAPSSLSGFNAGQWYIRSIQNEKEWYGADGAKKITFQVTIRAYGGDNSLGGISNTLL